MLNHDKIRLMTRLAIYEQNEGKEDLKINKYYKFDYVRLQILKAFVSCTIGFLLVLVLAAMYQFEYLILNATNLNFEMIGKYILLIYMMVSIFYIIIAITIAVIEYNNAKKGLNKYNFLLRKLNKIYAENKAKE